MKAVSAVLKPKQKILIQHKRTGIKRKVSVVKVYDSNSILVKNERERLEVLELLEYIILILPLLDRIIGWFKNLFRKRK